MFGKNKKSEQKEVAFGAEVLEKPFGDDTLDSVDPKYKLEQKEEVKEEALVPLTHSALGIYKDDSTGTWFVAKIKFNPITKQAEYTESKEAADGTKGVAMEQFRILASREVFN